ncbi:phosphoesterase PA-phosphatase [Cycloclasticus sp. 46_120_T64]|nr:phosphoesterase PA-phosphatase [Cycloclasticus sp. 46_120_T64]
MINELINLISQWVIDYPLFSGGIIFSVAMIESLAIIGFIVPGVAIMFAIGTLISSGTLELFSTILWAAAGASTGDGLSFFIGKHYKKRIYQLPGLKGQQPLFDKGHVFFEKYGIYSILIGRFIGPIRAIIPLIAGILDMPNKQYIPINIIASALWAPAYLFPGLFFGAAIAQLPQQLLDYWPWALALCIILIVFIGLRKTRHQS